MTEDDLSRLEALCESVPALGDGLAGPDGAVHAEAEDVNTGDFIAAARAALPDLIAEVRRLRGVQMPYEGFGDDARIMANYLTAVDKHDQIGTICRGAVERVLRAAAPPQDSVD